MAQKKTKSPRYRDLLYRQFAQIGKAVSSPKRLELLDLLCQGERTVEALVKETATSFSNISQHLRVLKTARLVDSRKEGLHVFYYLADASVGEFWRALRTLAVSRLAEAREVIRLFLEGKDDLEPIDPRELIGQVQRGDVVILDVRPEAEFKAGHIPQALSIPLKDLAGRLAEIPSDREVVAYCRGPYCILSLDAVTLLREHGIHARRLAEGLPEWQARGYPVDSGT